MLRIWHRNRNFVFDQAASEANVRPNALRKAGAYSKANTPKNEIKETGNSTYMWCRDAEGNMIPIAYDRFQEFDGDPKDFEWVLDETGVCRAKENGMLFPHLFRHFTYKKPKLYLMDGNRRNYRGDNVTTSETEWQLV